MSQAWTIILEIIKIGVPPLIVGFTVYYVIKELLTKQSQSKLIENQKDRQKTTLPLRLQAYERLSVFCERISIPNLVLRLRKEGMSAEEMKLSLLFAIRQEYEHNISQQVYVSENLWRIIVLARDHVSEIISQLCEQLESGSSALDLSRHLLNYMGQNGDKALDKALLAIKKEAGTLF